MINFQNTKNAVIFRKPRDILGNLCYSKRKNQLFLDGFYKGAYL